MAFARVAPDDLRYRPLNHAPKKPVGRSFSVRALGVLWSWFKSESPILTALNALVSLAILTFIFLMTPLGGERVRFPDTAALEMYVGTGLLGLALLKALRAWFARRKFLRRLFGFANALAFALMGSWLLATWFYEGHIPWPFALGISMRGGDLASDINYFDASIVPLFAPALAVLLGLAFSAKQLNSIRRATRERRKKTLAVLGFVASACTLSIGAYAGTYRYLGESLDSVVPATGPGFASVRSYEPLFAAGIPCHISDGFGPRPNPFDDRLSEFHPGIDIAVKQGTPVHAMASGTVIFSGIDRGFGNMVAIKANEGGSQPLTLVAGHMQQLFVAPGSFVHGGDVIGMSGSTGRSTGPHVHLQVCLDGHTTRSGDFVCGPAENPYESWRTLSAIVRSSCTRGPVV